MNNNQITRINLCVTPPAAIGEELTSIAARLSEDELKFRIDNKIRFPHITILMGKFEKDQIDTVIERLAAVPAIIQSEKLQFSAYGLTVSSNYYVEVGYNKTPELERVQNSAAAIVAALRTVSVVAPEPGMSPLETSYQNSVGYKLFAATYRPHVTLGAYKPRKDIAVPVTLGFEQLDFEATELSICESDEFGAMVRVIETIPLRVG